MSRPAAGGLIEADDPFDKERDMTLSSLPGRPTWIELFTTDPDTARTFYGELFGWTVRESGPEYGGYATFLRDGEPVAGLMRNDGQGPSAWSVSSCSATMARSGRCSCVARAVSSSSMARAIP